jgi:hypothetical protein
MPRGYKLETEENVLKSIEYAKELEKRKEKAAVCSYISYKYS